MDPIVMDKTAMQSAVKSGEAPAEDRDHAASSKMSNQIAALSVKKSDSYRKKQYQTNYSKSDKKKQGFTDEVDTPEIDKR